VVDRQDQLRDGPEITRVETGNALGSGISEHAGLDPHDSFQVDHAAVPALRAHPGAGWRHPKPGDVIGKLGRQGEDEIGWSIPSSQALRRRSGRPQRLSDTGLVRLAAAQVLPLRAPRITFCSEACLFLFSAAGCMSRPLSATRLKYEFSTRARHKGAATDR
jgi:hypothetical protein